MKMSEVLNGVHDSTGRRSECGEVMFMDMEVRAGEGKAGGARTVQGCDAWTPPGGQHQLYF